MTEQRITSTDESKRRFFRATQATGDIVTILAQEPGRGKLLELPAGSGHTSTELIKLGFDVTPADLFPEHCVHECVKADMEKPLPFEDATFDYMLCQEGIEHIEAPLSFLRECARVLKVGGKLVITTPNVLHLSARWSYFCTGHRTARRGYINEYTTLLGRNGDDLYHGHAWHWRYPVLRYALRLAGFDVKPPLSSKYSLSSAIWSVPMYPVLWLANRRSQHSALRKLARKKPEAVEHARRTLREIGDHLMSRPLLWGRTLILIAEKESPTFLEQTAEDGAS